MRINLIINDQCQLKCNHCNVVGKCETYLTTPEWEEVYDILTEFGDHIHLAGREPFINTDYQKFIQDERFIYTAVTNGVGLRKDLPDLDKFNKIIISWDTYHGCFLPRDLDLKTTSFGVSIVLTTDNWEDVWRSICDANFEYGIYDFYIAPVIPFTHDLIPDVITPKDLSTFYDMVVGGLERGLYNGNFTIDVKGPYVHEMSKYPVLFSHQNGSVYLEFERHCRCGLHEITICPDGTVLPCFFMFTKDYQKYSLGNILERETDRIIEDGMYMRRMNMDYSLRCHEKDKEECKSCTQKCPLWALPCIIP